MWLSSVNISLSLWKIIQYRRGVPALFGSPLLDIMWKDGSLAYLFHFFGKPHDCAYVGLMYFVFMFGKGVYRRSFSPCFDTLYRSRIYQHRTCTTVAGKAKKLSLICNETQIFLCVPSIPN
jgi:hypothetical protein